MGDSGSIMSGLQAPGNAATDSEVSTASNCSTGRNGSDCSNAMVYVSILRRSDANGA